MRAGSKIRKVANCTSPHRPNLSITGPVSKKRAILRRKVAKYSISKIRPRIGEQYGAAPCAAAGPRPARCRRPGRPPQAEGLPHGSRKHVALHMKPRTKLDFDSAQENGRQQLA